METEEETLEIMIDQENNTKQNVTTVENNAHYHLNQHKGNQYIVETVSKQRGEINNMGFDDFRNNRGNDSRRNNFRNDDRPREEHKAKCDKCGKDCTLPFKPTQGKPVYCRDCFREMKPRDDRRDNRGGNFRDFQRGGGNNRRGNFRDNDRGPREQHKATCDECKKECTLPFKPTQGKPVYCRDCFQTKRRD